MIEITSAQNPRVKALRALRMRKYREQEGRYLIEGIRIVEEALTLGAPVETLVYAPAQLTSERALALMEGAADVERLALTPQVFITLSERDEPQGLAAVVRIVERRLEEIPLAPNLLAVVACQLHDPGNLGAIIRTADAAGASGVMVVEPSVDLYDPHTVRATMGSLYALPIVRLQDEAALWRWRDAVRAAGIPVQVVGTSAHGQRGFYELDYRGPVALLIGSERQGLSDAVRAQADALARLPMRGRATSLNASAAAAAMLYEIARQRLAEQEEPIRGNA